METSQDRPNLAVLNIVALALVGVGASYWVLYYTDYFPVVTSLLGLGGVLAWVAFLLNVLQDARKDSLRGAFDRYCLQSKLFLVVVGGLPLIALSTFVAGRGTLIVDNLEAKEGRLVGVYNVEEDGTRTGGPVWRGPVPATSRVKVLLATGWFGSRTYYVKPSGLPAARVTTRSMRRKTVVVPQQFTEQPVILVRPAARILPHLSGLTLEVWLQDKDGTAPRSLGAQEYHGGSVWIGTDEGVSVPESVVERWKLELDFEQFDPRQVLNWLRPVAIAPTAQLRGGATVSVNLVDGDRVAFSAKVEIPRSGKILDFPKEAVLR